MSVNEEAKEFKVLKVNKQNKTLFTIITLVLMNSSDISLFIILKFYFHEKH